MRYLLSLAVLTLGSCLAFAEPTPADTAKPAVVPFEMLATRHLAVKIKVNGHGPYRVIFDTGAPVSLLNTKIAKEAGLVGEKTVKGPAFGMMGEKKIETLEIGDLKVENLTVMVMDHPTLGAVAKVLGPVDGILGFPFFARYRMTLDYQAMQLTFVPTDYKPADLMANMMVMMMAKSKPPKKVLASSAVWGLVPADKDKSDENAGITIKQVLPGSSAEQAGLQAGDRLLVLDAIWTDSVDDCFRAAQGVKPGQAVRLRLKRGDQETELTIKPSDGL